MKSARPVGLPSANGPLANPVGRGGTETMIAPVKSDRRLDMAATNELTFSIAFNQAALSDAIASLASSNKIFDAPQERDCVAFSTQMRFMIKASLK